MARLSRLADVEVGDYAPYTTGATHQVKKIAGFLRGICVNRVRMFWRDRPPADA